MKNDTGWVEDFNNNENTYVSKTVLLTIRMKAIVMHSNCNSQPRNEKKEVIEINSDTEGYVNLLLLDKEYHFF